MREPLDGQDVLDPLDEQDTPDIQFNPIDHAYGNLTSSVSLNSFDCPNEGLSYIAGFIAARLKNDFPELGQKTSEACPYQQTNYPWLTALSRGGLTQPSTEFFNMIKQFENIFLQFHGPTLSKESNVIKNFQKVLLQKFPSLHPKIAMKYSRTRTFIRIKFLNHKLKSKLSAIERRESKKKSQFSKSH